MIRTILDALAAAAAVVGIVLNLAVTLAFVTLFERLRPVDVLGNVLSIATSADDRARARYLLALQLLGENRPESVERAFEHLEAIVAMGKTTEWYDDALFALATHLAQGRNVIVENGEPVEGALAVRVEDRFDGVVAVAAELGDELVPLLSGDLVADQLLALDKLNPQVAARMMTPFGRCSLAMSAPSNEWPRLLLPIALASTASQLWIAVALVGLAAAAHQGWSANLFTLASDTFPRQAVGSVVGFGGMAGAVGGLLIAKLTGYILQTTGSYVPVFLIAASAYLAALAIEHGATIVTFDRDFACFEGVRWTVPAD